MPKLKPKMYCECVNDILNAFYVSSIKLVIDHVLLFINKFVDLNSQKILFEKLWIRSFINILIKNINIWMNTLNWSEFCNKCKICVESFSQEMLNKEVQDARFYHLIHVIPVLEPIKKEIYIQLTQIQIKCKKEINKFIGL